METEFWERKVQLHKSLFWDMDMSELFHIWPVSQSSRQSCPLRTDTPPGQLDTHASPALKYLHIWRKRTTHIFKMSSMFYTKMWNGVWNAWMIIKKKNKKIKIKKYPINRFDLPDNRNCLDPCILRRILDGNSRLLCCHSNDLDTARHILGSELNEDNKGESVNIV